ncbi:hypothetical protein VUR80DRAFT_5408 [Thermomyces stellatus]
MKEPVSSSLLLVDAPSNNPAAGLCPTKLGRHYPPCFAYSNVTPLSRQYCLSNSNHRQKKLPPTPKIAVSLDRSLSGNL